MLWLHSPGGGEKMTVQADQTLCKVLKCFKFCWSDVSPGWNGDMVRQVLRVTSY